MTKALPIEKRRREARRLVIEALRGYLGSPHLEAPKGESTFSVCEIHKKLDEEDVLNGVVAFLLFTNLGAGSVGDIDLYELLKAYLLDLDKRRKLNAVLQDQNK